MLKKILVSTLIVSALAGCSTVTVQPKPIPKLSNSPSFEETKHFFFWGLAGNASVNTKEVCGSKNVKQMQTQQTFANGLLTVFTLGIYAPHSVKVWCE